MQKWIRLAPDLPSTLRLGLATRGSSRLKPADIQMALDAGVNYLNWCGHSDGLSEAVAGLPARERERIVLAAQFSARSATQAEAELEKILSELNTDYVDILTFYYVESETEWDQIKGPTGSLKVLKQAQREGKVRRLGLTSHQRQLAAAWAETGLLDLLMIRFNAAHRKAQAEVFPKTNRLNVPVVAFTCLRWTDLLKPTAGNSPGYTPWPAAEWYRYVLSYSSVSIALMAPQNRAELKENLRLLDDWRALSGEEIQKMNSQGDLVRQWNRHFP